MFEVIKCRSSIKNYRKQFWQELNYAIFLQNKSEENRKLNAKQRKFCVSLLRKIKKRYYENLNEKSVIDNKLFLKTVKLFWKIVKILKIEGKNKIHSTENGELIKMDLETAQILNDFFT